MTPSTQRILIEHDRIGLPGKASTPAPHQSFVTVLANVAYYGYGLSEQAYAMLAQAGSDDLERWWHDVDKALATITGDDKKMDDFVVYKNFPAEVIAMNQAEYWSRQILMYWGFSNSYFTEAPEQRSDTNEALPVKIVHPASDTSLTEIRNSLLHLPARWTSRQFDTIYELAKTIDEPVHVAEAPFKENMVLLTMMLMEGGHPASVETATDVLRLAVGLSDGDISLREPCKLQSFPRRQRRFLLGLLERAANLDEDIRRRPGQFKRLLFALHPGDYKDRFPKTVSAYNRIYRGVPVPSYNREIEKLLTAKNRTALSFLKSRPGEFVRRLRVATRLFGSDAVDSFTSIIPKLSTTQLLKIERHLQTTAKRDYRTFPPRGNWSKLQIRDMKPVHRFNKKLARELSELIAKSVRDRVVEVVPEVLLSAAVEQIKLQSSDSDLTPYGRGTVFPIPDNIRFIRSASYWESGPTNSNLWYDNGWNFFDEGWSSLGACCWNANTFGNRAAIFSGDPTNSKDLEGRACQMIDLYLHKLKSSGVRYAVWNILCYSRKSFDEAVDVHAALQWGEEAQAGKLFDPSRSVFSFPVRGSNMTKYVAYIDVLKSHLIYMDANLYGRVHSAASNKTILAKTMPAFVEYLAAQPSVHDLFKRVPQAQTGMPVLFHDSDHEITKGMAYVFQPRNRNNQFDPFALDSLL